MYETTEEVIKALRGHKQLSVIANCHLPGVFSIVLAERTGFIRGMRRVFFVGPNCRMNEMYSQIDGRTDYTLKPHNHRQNLRLIGLCGKAVSYQYDVEHYGPATEFVFTSALANDRAQEMGVVRERRVTLKPRGSVELAPDKTLRLRWDDVHTVLARNNSAWLVIEDRPAPKKARQLCYSSHDDLTLSSEGLYVPLDKAHQDEVVEQLLDRL